MAVEVTVPRNARRRPARGVQLHWADLDADDIVGERVGGVTGVVRTVLDCARGLPFADALTIADSALRTRACESDELRSRAAALRGAGSATVRRVVWAADGRADNPMESVLRAVVLGTGVGGFEPQLQIEEDGLLARVDLGDRRRRIALEADSYTFHGTRAALDRDCRRYSDLVAADWSVLRFSWEQVMFDRDWVAARVTALASLADARRAR